MTYQLKTTYTSHDYTGWMIDEMTGRRVLSRVPNHPTRPALPFEVETWWEDVPPAMAAMYTEWGHIVRLR